MEYVDLVDQFRAIVYPKIPRQEIDKYSKAYLQIVIVVIVNDQGKILVQQRAHTKRINPGAIDLICGAIQSEESPYATAIRESIEETGVSPQQLTIVNQGLNTYRRYRYLLMGHSNQLPSEVLDPSEVNWAKYEDIVHLHQMHHLHQWEFVDEFFKDLQVALNP